MLTKFIMIQKQFHMIPWIRVNVGYNIYYTLQRMTKKKKKEKKEIFTIN